MDQTHTVYFGNFWIALNISSSSTSRSLLKPISVNERFSFAQSELLANSTLLQKIFLFNKLNSVNRRSLFRLEKKLMWFQLSALPSSISVIFTLVSTQAFIRVFGKAMQQRHFHYCSPCRSFLDSFIDILKYDTLDQTMVQ